MNELEKTLPWADWYVGWHMNPIAASTHGRRTIDQDFFTAGVLGGIGVNHPDHKWSTRFTYPPHWEFVGCKFLSCGCSIAFSCEDQIFESAVLSPEKGIIVGELSSGADLAFFSLEHSFRSMGDVLVAEVGKLKILQAKKQTDTHLRFVLVIAEGSQVDLEGIARPYLEETSALEIWQRELLRREKFLSRFQGEQREIVNFGAESFYAALKMPRGSFSGRWLDTGTDDIPGFHTQLLLPVLEFFNQVEPRLAAEIFEGVFSFQDKAGGIPDFLVCEGLYRQVAFSWPVMCQAALLFLEDTEQHEMLLRVMPKLEKFLVWALKYFRQQDADIPCWNSPEESFIPETFSPELATPCLTTFLILELEAFQELAVRMDYTPTALKAQQEHTEMVRVLNTFWNAKSNCFRSRELKGSHASFPTFSDLFPLAWKGLDEAKRGQVLRQLENPTGFNTYQGTAMWLDETGNAEVAPVSGLHLFLLNRLLDKNETVEGLASRGRDYLERLSNEFDPQIGLTADLRYIFHHSLEIADATSAAADLGTAAYVVLLSNLELRAPSAVEEAPAPVAVMEEHRKLTSTSIISIIVLSVVLICGVFILKVKLTSSQYETLSGLAIKQFENGNYEKAIETYQKLAETTDGDIQRLMHIRLASCYIKIQQYEMALTIYEELYESDELDPKMLMNMGLSYYQLERYDQAQRIYEEFLEIYELSHPEYAARAKTAIQLLKGEKL